MSHNSQQPRIMALTPSSRGFGFAVFDGPETLVEWGCRSAKGKDKNAEALPKAEKLMAHFLPDRIILQDPARGGTRRSGRVRALNEQLIALARGRKVKVTLLSHKQIRQPFFGTENGTKQGIASVLAKRFPDELGDRLPPKRRAWMSEDARMDIFDAVALALVHLVRSAGRGVTSGRVKSPADKLALR